VRYDAPDGPVADEVRTILGSMNFSLVELAIQRIRKRTHIHCTIYNPEGFDLDRLSEVHRLIEPRLELMLEDRDMYIEFSSPGIDRKFKSFHEFGIFTGLRVSIMPTDQKWFEATIERATETRVDLPLENGTTAQFDSEGIVKARLSN